MVTIYDLLEVKEDASKEEIEKAYQKLVLEYQTNPVLTPEENRQNKQILNKLKMGYEILMNDEKRSKYDMNLSKKRAEELIKSVPEKEDKYEEDDDYSEEKSNVQNTNNIINEKNKEIIKEEIQETGENNTYYDIPKAKNTRTKEDEDGEVELSKEEQKRIKKAAQKEFNDNLKKVQKAEEEYNKAYNDAYNQYLKKMGYNVKEKWTLKRLKNTVITILAIVIVCAILWIIPPIQKILIDVYEKNLIVKSLVDIIKFLVQCVAGIFK